MSDLLSKLSVGAKVISDGRIYTLTGSLGGGVYTYSDTQTPPATGTIEFTQDSVEGADLYVIPAGE